MKSAGWSTLLLGTFLVTAGGGLARAEDTAAVVAAERAIDAAVERAIDAAVAAADDDRSLDTGSIAPLGGTPKGGLTQLAPRETKPLKELVEAPEPKPAKPTEPAATKAADLAPAKAEPAVATEAAKAEAAPAEKAVEKATEAKSDVPTEAVAKSEAPAVVTPAASERPIVGEAKTAPASEPVAETKAATAPVETTPAVVKSAEGPAVEAKPVEAAAGEAKPVEAAAVPASPVVPAVEAPVVTPAVAPQAEPVPAVHDHHVSIEAPKVETVETAKSEAPAATTTAALETAKPEAKPAEVPKPEAVAAKPAEAAAPVATATTPAAVAATPVAAAPAQVPAVVTGSTPVAAPASAGEAPTLTPREADVAAAHAAQIDAEALKKVVDAHALEAGSADDRKDRAAIAAFYGERKYLPLFVGAEDLTARAKVAVAHFRAATQDGLEPRDYALPAMRAATPEGRAEAEYSVAATVLRYARHLQAGRFEPSKLSDLVTAKPIKPEPAVVLRDMASSADVAVVLDAFAPPHAGYKKLKAELARLRGEVEVPVVRLPPGPVLKPGAKDARVAMLRERLGVSAVASDADVFDPSLADLVKSFQKERGLSANGALNRETVAALNDESRGNGDKIADLTVNMERWRWLPRDLGQLHVFVNIPDFFLDVMKDGKSIHHARVVTGRPENQTPIFSETMKYVVVNPYWNVPQSIIQKEMLAKLQGGQGLSRSFEVEVGNRTVDPSSVDWSQVSARQVSIRQRPGDGNALGNIKFMFPNQHSVYIHDTSSRGLFAQSYRALSHGCVRVHEPFSFADAVLSDEPGGLGGAQLKKMLGGGEKEISLKTQIPVHINYFTVFVDDAGQVQSRRDVYGHDGKMKRILGL